MRSGLVALGKAEKLAKLPKNEIVVVSYYSHDHKLLFSLTRKTNGTGAFCLYEHNNKDNTWLLLGKGENPVGLEEKFQVEKKMRRGMKGAESVL